MSENKNPNFCGYFSFVLHSHLPWVLNHGIWPHGTNWVYEAAAETYIPIIRECNKLVKEGYKPYLSIDLSPVLCEMLIDKKFVEGFIDYCLKKIEGAKKDLKQFEEMGYDPRQIQMAKFWIEFYQRTLDYFTKDLNKDIIRYGFKPLQDQGYFDIITCAATHGYAPLLSKESSIHAQFNVASKAYQKLFGKPPHGTWLAECAYRPAYKWKKPVGNDKNEYDRPGVEVFLSKNGLKYFFIDTALLLGGVSQGVYASRFPLLKELWERFEAQYKPSEENFERTPFQPYLVSTDAKNPVAIFTRDENTGILVWSGEHGYPGCSVYLDFHKKHYSDPFGGGSGLRYWKVTDAKADLGSKQIYNINDISSFLDQNAGHYKEAIKGVLRKNQDKVGKTGILIAMYDCELFGHWWFEGPWFLERVVRYMAMDPEIELTNCRRYLEQYPPNKVVSITEGSWGQGSSHYIWLNKDTSWTWEKIYEIEDLVEDLVTKYHTSKNENVKRLLTQLCRENLILQASDWQFLISTWSARDYAENRFGVHYENCKRLAQLVSKALTNELTEADWKYVSKLEESDNLFSDLDISCYVKDAWKEK